MRHLTVALFVAVDDEAPNRIVADLAQSVEFRTLDRYPLNADAKQQVKEAYLPGATAFGTPDERSGCFGIE